MLTSAVAVSAVTLVPAVDGVKDTEKGRRMEVCYGDGYVIGSEPRRDFALQRRAGLNHKHTTTTTLHAKNEAATAPAVESSEST